MLRNMFYDTIKKSLKLSIFIVLVSCFDGYSVIQEVNSLTDSRVQDALRVADEKTLILFDVDNTLTYYPDDGATYFLYEPEKASQEDASFAKEAYDQFQAYKKEKGVDFVKDRLGGVSLVKSKGDLIEPEAIIKAISMLQSQGAKAIAFTACPAGDFGPVSDAHVVRFEDLKKFDIDFSSAFLPQKIVFDKFNKSMHGFYPMFYQGILFTNWNNDKGPIFGAFLDQVAWSPSKVIFFDDSKGNLESVEQEMNNRGIQYEGFWYRAAEKIPLKKFDQKIEKILLQYILERNELLSVDEASAILSASKNDVETDFQ